MASLAVLTVACTGEEPPEPPDTTAPVLSALAVSPGRAAAGATLTVTLSSSEALQSLQVRVAGRDAQCAPQGAGHRCEYAVLGQEAEGVQQIVAVGTDPAGNSGTATVTVGLDFTAPVITLSAVPLPLSEETIATVAFSSADVGAVSHTCALDGAAAAACTGSFTTPSLAEGDHVIEVTATDDVGNHSSARVEFSIVLSLPQTTVLTGIPALTRALSHPVSFESDLATATFECRLDSAAFSACTSPHTVTGYGEGPHTFEVRAVSGPGAHDPTPASVSFVADRTAPVATIGNVPATGASALEIPFSFNEEGSTAECRIDGGAIASCVSPFALSGLSDGSHQFEVRGTDPAGNVAATFASVTFTVDTTPPSTSITARPNASTNQRGATFQFSSSETNSTFLCSVDSSALAACSSPHVLSGMTDGAHLFEVVAVDRYGNADATSAAWSWTVDATPPVASFSSPVPALIDRPELTVTFTADESATFQCSVDGAAFFACASPRRLINLTDTVNTPAGAHVLTVRPADSAGNVGSTITASFEVDLSVPAPGVVRLLAPNPARTSDRTPTFQWAGANATGYDFELSTDPSFQDPARQVAALIDSASTTFTPSTELALGSYYVRLRGKNSIGYGEYDVAGRIEITGGWVRTPKVRTLYSVACKSASECVIVGEAGTILRTTDGGLTFSEPPSPVSNTLQGVAYADDSTVIAVGGDGIIRSSNGGVSWSRVYDPVSQVAHGDLAIVDFKDGRGVALGSSGRSYSSFDAGRTWAGGGFISGLFTAAVAVVSNVDTDPQNPGFVAVMVEGGRGLQRTSDGGRSWSTSQLPLGATNCTDISFFDANTAFVSCQTATLYRSNNGGLSWSTASTTAPTPIGRVGAVLARSADRALFTHDLDPIYSSGSNVRAVNFTPTATWENAVRTDGGSPRGATLRSLASAGLTHAFAVGSDVFLIEETAGGIEFRRAPGVAGFLPSGTANIRSIVYPTASTGYLFGTSGFAVKTTDGGASFSPLNIRGLTGMETLVMARFLDADTGYVAGRNENTRVSSLAKTTDGGATWTRFDMSSTTAVAWMDVKDSTTGYAVAGSSKVWTLNSSGTWVEGTPVPTSGYPGLLATVAVVSNSEVYVGGGNGGDIARWNGTSWIIESVSGNGLGRWISSFALGSGVIVFANEDGQIYRRDGSGWTKVFEDPSARDIRMIHFLDTSNGWAVGESGLVLSTTDGGNTWTVDATFPATENNWAVLGLGTTEVLVGSSSQALWRNPDFGG